MTDNNDRIRDTIGALFCLLLAGIGIAAAILIINMDRRIKLLDKRMVNIEFAAVRQGTSPLCEPQWFAQELCAKEKDK